MDIPDLARESKAKDIINCSDHTKSEDQHDHSADNFIVGKKDDSQRNICKRCSYKRQHRRNASDNKPEPGFFNAKNIITYYCYNSLQKCNYRNSYSIAVNQILHFTTELMYIFIL